MQFIQANYSTIAGDKQRLELRMLSFLSAKTSDRILDAGCGDGRLTRKIKEQTPGVKILGIELDPNLAQQAQANGIEVGIFGVQDIVDHPELHGQFDKVFCNLVLNWLKNDNDFAKAINGFSKALVKGGNLVCTFPLQLNPQIRQEIRDVLHPYFNNARDQSIMLATIGKQACESLQDSDLVLAELIPIRYSNQYAVKKLLGQSGFLVKDFHISQQKSPLPNGLKAWLDGFILPHIFSRLDLPETEKSKISEQLTARLSNPSLGLRVDDRWFIVADMLSFTAVKA